MVVHKLNPEVGTAGCTPPESLHWSHKAHQRFWERIPIGLGFPWEGGGLKLPLVNPDYTMITLDVCHQVPLHKPHTALWALNLPPQSI